MHNPDSFYKASHGQIFQTELSDGATFSDPIQGDFNARMSAEGYVSFSEHRREGPITDLQMRFEPCGFVLGERRSHTLWSSDSMCDDRLDISPEEFLNHPELFYPFTSRLSLVAVMLEQIPNQLPEAYPKLKGKFPYELVFDLNRFLQYPEQTRAILDSKYGIDIDIFAHDPNYTNILESKRINIESLLRRAHKYFKYD
ncbi:MAG: hypothetical protein PHQ59_00275 [Candidatus Daviesbacteria bacterium]|nr:hypothetical protein [Candidatus Daviesbacteria bacterium]